MSMYKPEGVIVAMVTPMTPEGLIDEVALRAQVERHVTSGVSAVFVLGTNGEFFSLDENEKELVIRTAVEQADHRIPVLAGVGCPTTMQTVRLAKKAEALGADALSVISPYFGKTSDSSLIDFYQTVAGSVSIPILLYNIPMRTGNSISPQAVRELAKVPGIAAIKDSSGNFDNTLRYLEITDRKFPVLAGNDSLILSTLMAGGVGAIAGTANLFPGRVSGIYRAFREGNLEEATRIQDGLRHIRNCFSLGDSIGVVKHTANLLGQKVGEMRPPFGVPAPEWDARLTQVLKDFYTDWS